MIGILKNTGNQLILGTDELQALHDRIAAQQGILLGQSPDGYVYLIQGRVVIVVEAPKPPEESGPVAAEGSNPPP